MKKGKWIAGVVVAVLVIVASFCLAVAAGTYSVESTISGTSLQAESNLGRFTIAPGGKAYGFSGSSVVMGFDGNTTYNLMIKKVDEPSAKVVFERNPDGRTDSPVPLGSLTLGPGKYVLVIGGKAGGRAVISFTGENVTVGQ